MGLELSAHTALPAVEDDGCTLPAPNAADEKALLSSLLVGAPSALFARPVAEDATLLRRLLMVFTGVDGGASASFEGFARPLPFESLMV